MKAKKIVISTVVLGVLSLVAVLGVHSVGAYENGPYSNIVQKLVGRFNLNADEVQQVFDEAREERREEMQARFGERGEKMRVGFEERLNQAVSEGKITEEQKQALLAKKVETQTNFEELKDLSFEERKENMEARRQEVQAWAEENGIDLSLVPVFFGGGRRGGHGGFWFSK